MVKYALCPYFLAAALIRNMSFYIVVFVCTAGRLQTHRSLRHEDDRHRAEDVSPAPARAQHVVEPAHLRRRHSVSVRRLGQGGWRLCLMCIYYFICLETGSTYKAVFSREFQEQKTRNRCVICQVLAVFFRIWGMSLKI